jgi:hypothetical protein
LEVVLAVVIVVGLLFVVLFFYQQAARVRTDVLIETERVASVRLIMDRLTTELRAACRHEFYQTPLVGEGSFLQFITTSVPERGAWRGGALGRLAEPETDLRLVTYSLGSAIEGTNVTAAGVMRAEDSLLERRSLSSSSEPGRVVETGKPGPLLITDQLRFLRFRYSNGSAWRDSWNEPVLPRGVEVSLATAPPAEPTSPESYPEGLFRRVIYLPAGGQGAAVSLMEGMLEAMGEEGGGGKE